MVQIAHVCNPSQVLRRVMSVLGRMIVLEATTGHKLQGMSKDKLIVLSWNYSFKNWIYVVLSRVRTLSGLYLCQPIDETRPFPVDDKLLIEEERLERMEEELMEHRRPRAGIGTTSSDRGPPRPG